MPTLKFSHSILEYMQNKNGIKYNSEEWVDARLLIIDEVVYKVHWEPGGLSARKDKKITGVLQSALWFL